MSGYAYLDGSVQNNIGSMVDRVLLELDMHTPPVGYNTLYESESLEKHILTLERLKSLGLKTNIGSVQEHVRGLLLANDRQVFVIDENRYVKRIHFVLAHEYGHFKLPWHRQALWKCTQFDLSPSARRQLEAEANFFASELGFMRGLFFEMLESSELNIGNLLSLSDTFEMSVEATLRRAAELELRPTAFVSLTVNEKSDERFLRVRYSVVSAEFKKRFGTIKYPQALPRNHSLCAIVTDPMTNLIGRCTRQIFFGDKRIPMAAEVWKNQYNIFVVLQPAE